MLLGRVFHVALWFVYKTLSFVKRLSTEEKMSDLNLVSYFSDIERFPRATTSTYWDKPILKFKYYYKVQILIKVLRNIHGIGNNNEIDIYINLGDKLITLCTTEEDENFTVGEILRAQFDPATYNRYTTDDKPLRLLVRLRKNEL